MPKIHTAHLSRHTYYHKTSFFQSPFLSEGVAPSQLRPYCNTMGAHCQEEKSKKIKKFWRCRICPNK
nr:MAG TPA: hypothetical protein [Caudoviricetes sp.]